MKIGLFGGSFNPIHEGHLKIAQFAFEKLNLDKLIFIPAATNPFKKNKKYAPSSDRIKMIQLAIEDKPHFEISEFETKRGGVSYTFETIRYFKNKFPSDELFFLMGSDQLPKLNKWEYIDEISQKVQLVIFKRSNKINKINAKKYNAIILNNPIHPESSTSIREGNLIYTPEKVNEYIGNNYLYASEILHNILKVDPARAKHCKQAAEFAAELAKTVKYDAKIAYYAGLFHDVAKRLSESESREFMHFFGLDAYDKKTYPNFKLHQICGALWVEFVYKNSNRDLIRAISIHTTLDLELNTLDKILFIADKICQGRAFPGVQKLRELVMSDFEAGFKAVLKHNYDYNINKGITFDNEALAIYKKWMD
ncbi:nicotinate-nucleotide adenylyltransferase [Mycoplasmopsis gallinarum]|uniref:Probable nicotinate-nucleotide adenylyltransferase n=1 Tax=Mycoplasmopsis gallinarum TaxID=29557 RepID=A0A168RB47_9BACT|nr:nicotinate-nucleotide adenylyltransferase [Mycoplasmopsis gallinarum]OAB48799.1 Nicotinate-nucleotide adenylyltransferase [Mycoplasmopsis gallinarum]